MPPSPASSPRFHGRVPGDRPCAAAGCGQPGEFRAPLAPGDFDGPGQYRWLCLDHVRDFNARYNFFTGMSADEIAAAQSPYAGWERETRAFAATGADAPPRWHDFKDPMDALGARYARFRRGSTDDGPMHGDGQGLSEETGRDLKTLGLGPDADRRALRRRYADLVRRYHPDRNGGDRRHERTLADVIAAYTRLKRAAMFA